MTGLLSIGPWQLLAASLLVVVAGLVSIGLRLGLERSLFIAALRTVVQLLLMGYVLAWVFRVEHPGVVLGMMVVMVLAAGRAAVSRSSRVYTGVTAQVMLTLLFSGLLTVFTVTGFIVRVPVWYQPQYLIPLLGMILGNGLTGISLCLDELLRGLSQERALVEQDLCLGATAWEAARDPIHAAVRRGMIPTINNMMVVGVVSLPGMMTGQILAGADPITAVTYQIVVMFMIAAATAVGCMGLALLSFHRLFNQRHQLQVHLIHPRSGAGR